MWRYVLKQSYPRFSNRTCDEISKLFFIWKKTQSRLKKIYKQKRNFDLSGIYLCNSLRLYLYVRCACDNPLQHNLDHHHPPIFCFTYTHGSPSQHVSQNNKMFLNIQSNSDLRFETKFCRDPQGDHAWNFDKSRTHNRIWILRISQPRTFLPPKLPTSNHRNSWYEKQAEVASWRKRELPWRALN